MLQMFRKRLAFCKKYVKINIVRKNNGVKPGRTLFMKLRKLTFVTLLFVLALAILFPATAEANRKGKTQQEESYS